ncbi:hypothetical protein QBC33DRAFT_371427 [Phialemonium atrogriseum]|uniref:FAD synthase n=1 Tax=Phialemonium atrogriseum TaxID=1093897 RepID=A0AAJ0C1T0_9PEZI|nr:uncharacterized protein QBC33DRAFT_371427 [Phialemonium atrogriseum]KAK1768325.1 hypothetical protein QBC33DRAFT_371427 [Phialemonium atrogriseum]
MLNAKMPQDSCSHQDGPLISSVEKATTASASDGPHAPRTLPEICLTLRRKVIAFLEEKTDDEVLRNTQGQARVSMGVIEEALRRYRPDELSLSYNGGKDCLVLLVLMLACLAAPTSTSTSGPDAADAADAVNLPEPAPKPQPPRPLQAIYIAPPDPFPEVEDFVATSTIQYHLDLTRYALPMRPALEAYLGDRTAVKAIFMGTRRTDPHCECLTHFSPTDADWPQFMRVNPMIDWHYAEIWAFIRHLGISYCSLYQQGFSSLGGMKNTRPNPVLALDADAKTFRPAYELMRDDQERLGRDR